MCIFRKNRYRAHFWIQTFIHVTLHVHTICLNDSFHIFIFFCFIRLSLAKFSQFSITLYGALVWGRREAHLKFLVGTGRGEVSFISRKMLCTYYSYLANNFWQIISERLFIEKSHRGHLKHSRKGEILNFS